MAQCSRSQTLLGSLAVRLLAVLSSGTVPVLGCSEAAEPVFFGDPDAGGLAGLGGRGGSAGSGSAGRGGAAGMAGGGSAGLGGAPDAGGDAGCSSDAECGEQGACKVARCSNGACVGELAAAGTPCGSSSDDECSNPDTCDGSGQCSPNHEPAGTACGNGNDDECANPDVCGNGLCLPSDEANGTACSGGSCTLAVCVEGQPVGCPAEVAAAAPFTTQWSSVGRPDLYVGGCDSLGTPDYALVFTAPATATFRFTATALVDGTPYTGADPTEPFEEPPDGDAVLTVAQGSCAGGAATQLACNDDAAEGSRDAQLELPLTNGQVVTVYLNELTQSGGGTGTLTITQLP